MVHPRDQFRSFESDLQSKRKPNPKTSGPGAGLAGHLLLPYEPIHLLNLLDLFFYNIKYF